MQYKQTLVRLCPKPLKGLFKFSLLFLFFSPFVGLSQATTYLPQDARENIYLERLEIKTQTDSVLNFSKTKPFSRKYVVEGALNWWARKYKPNDVIPVDAVD